LLVRGGTGLELDLGRAFGVTFGKLLPVAVHDLCNPVNDFGALCHRRSMRVSRLPAIRFSPVGVNITTLSPFAV
jgi:hypothetical protein